MNYIEEIFLRADIQHIREFLLHGTESSVLCQEPYKERIAKPEKKLYNRVHEIYSTEEECEAMMAVIFDYSSAVEQVYMEIGLQVGIVLANQLFRNFKIVVEEE